MHSWEVLGGISLWNSGLSNPPSKLELIWDFLIGIEMVITASGKKTEFPPRGHKLNPFWAHYAADRVMNSQRIWEGKTPIVWVCLVVVGYWLFVARGNPSVCLLRINLIWFVLSLLVCKSKHINIFVNKEGREESCKSCVLVPHATIRHGFPPIVKLADYDQQESRQLVSHRPGDLRSSPK